MKSPCLVAAMLLACASVVHAQDFSARPITIMVGVAPGGVTDLATRAYANAVSKNTGWKVVVENRTGAGGAVAAKAVETAAPDGHTLLTVVGAQFASIPAMQSPSAVRSGSRLPADHADIPARAVAGGAGRLSGQHDCRPARARQEEGWRLVVRHARRRQSGASARRQDRARDRHADAIRALSRWAADDRGPGDRPDRLRHAVVYRSQAAYRRQEAQGPGHRFRDADRAYSRCADIDRGGPRQGARRELVRSRGARRARRTRW